MPDTRTGKVTQLDYGAGGRQTITIGSKQYRCQVDATAVDWKFGDIVAFEAEQAGWGLPVASNIKRSTPNG